MITVHHLNNSRSQRILWLLEELGQTYEIVFHQRDPNTRLAPPSLKVVHPLGKSPVVVDDAHGAWPIIESGAIVEVLIERYGQGRFRPPVGSDDWVRYVQWLHFAEGSAMLPLLLKLYAGLIPEPPPMLTWRIESEIENHFDFMNQALEGREFACDMGITGADVQLLFVLEAGSARGGLDRWPTLVAYRDRLQARPAYKRALEKGGPYQIGR